MKPLTPMDARRSLDYAEKHDTHLAVGHRRALETIANMHEEWVVTYDCKEVGGPATLTITQSKDSADRPLDQDTARQLAGQKVLAGCVNVRVIYRYTTEMKEA